MCLLWKIASYKLSKRSENKKKYTQKRYVFNFFPSQATIKRYRYVTQNLSRNSSFVENCEDSLRVLFIQSLYRIKQHAKKLPKSEKKLKDDPESIKIRSFFKNIDEENGSIIKWKGPELEERFDLAELHHREDLNL